MIFICTYSNGNVGLAQELQRYLIRRKKSFFLLLHPLDLSLGQQSALEKYENGTLTRTIRSIPSPSIYPIHYFRCVFTTFWDLLKTLPQVDLYIAFSNIDALVGLFFRLFKKIKVVHVSTDFLPKGRFPNPVMNAIYSLCDKLAYRWSDAVWHMYNERGALKKYKHRTKSFDVLDGNNFRRIERLPLSSINPHRLIYIGQINRDCRLEEAVEAIGILKPLYPHVGLDIISSGDPEYEGRLKRLAHDHNITDAVTFHGQISDPEKYERLIKKCGWGLCLYEIDPNDLAWYGTPLKIYLYGSCGTPTIASDTMGPFTKEYFKDNRIGFLSPRGTLVDILRNVFSKPDEFAKIRERTIEWAAQFDYDDKFDKYLSLV